MIQGLLTTLGLTDKEIAIYLAVTGKGKISAVELMRLTGVNRTTVYSVAKILEKKGLIREERGKTTYFVARTPDDLEQLLEQEEEQLRQRKHVMHQAIGALRPLAGKADMAVPLVQNIDEEGLKNFLHRRHKTWVESIMQYDGIWHGYQDHSFVENYEEWIDWSWAQPFARTLQLQLFTNKSIAEERMSKKSLDRRKIKFWQYEDDIAGTTWVNGDYVVLLTTRTRPHYAVEIRDAKLAASMRTMFRALWQTTGIAA